MAPQNPDDHSKILNFQFQSRSQPDDNCQLFQDTVPLDDTVALDCCPDETQIQLDIDMEIREDPDCIEDWRMNRITEQETEVALDSEDEADSSVEKFRGKRELPDVRAYRSIKGNKVGFFKRLPCLPSVQLKDSYECSLADQQCGRDARKSPASIRSDQVCAGLNDMSADEPEKTSQLNALDFVNTYLSQNKVAFSPELKPRDVSEKVPPASALKGCQSLAKKIGNPDGIEGTFEWVDNNHHGEIGFLSKRIGATFGLEGSLQRTVIRHQESGHFDSKEGGSPAKQCWKKSMNPQIEATSSVSSDSRNVAALQKHIKKKEQMSQVNFDKNQIQLGQESDVCNIETNAPGMFDVGISTQMAAEAMEALSNSFVIDNNVDQHSQNLLIGSPTLVMKSKTHNRKPCTHKGDFSYLEATPRMSKQRKSSSSNGTSSSFFKHPNYQELDNKPEKAAKRKISEFMAVRLQGRDTNTAAQNECSNRHTLKPVSKRKENEHELKNYIKEIEDHQNSSLPFKNISLGKQSAQKESFDQRTGKGTGDEPHNRGTKENNITKSSTITYKRKRTSLVTKPSLASSAGMCSNQPRQREIFSHLAGHMFGEGEIERTKDAEIIPQERVSDIGKVCVITYQRKKSPLNAKRCELLTAEEKNTTLCSNTPELKANKLTHQIEDSLELSSFTWNSTKRKRTLCKRTRHSEAAKNQFNLFLVFGEKENYRKPCNKKRRKSSILKELVGLGTPYLKKDFKWHDSRKRRDMANVKVLFSQHLDDNIVKQQKRILARYHISIASSPMDATHFVADKFVRTRNMLETIALGKPVVTHLWLQSCAQASCLIDEKSYILRDVKKEKELGFSMPVSLAHASQYPLLEGQRVLITPNLKPDKDTISSLVKAVGGQAIEEVQISALKIPDDFLILSCEEDKDICVPFLQKGIAVYSSELLLNGIIIRKIEYERHQLFTNYSQRNHQASKR